MNEAVLDLTTVVLLGLWLVCVGYDWELRRWDFGGGPTERTIYAPPGRKK